MIRCTFGVAGSTLFCIALGVGVAAGARGGKAGDVAKGRAVADQQCAMCHVVDSPENKMGPSLQGLFKKKTLKNGKPVNDANVMDQIVNGGGTMPPMGGSVTGDDRVNLLAYLHTL